VRWPRGPRAQRRQAEAGLKEDPPAPATRRRTPSSPPLAGSGRDPGRGRRGPAGGRSSADENGRVPNGTRPFRVFGPGAGSPRRATPAGWCGAGRLKGEPRRADLVRGRPDRLGDERERRRGRHHREQGGRSRLELASVRCGALRRRSAVPHRELGAGLDRPPSVGARRALDPAVPPLRLSKDPVLPAPRRFGPGPGRGPRGRAAGRAARMRPIEWADPSPCPARIRRAEPPVDGPRGVSWRPCMSSWWPSSG
jgi:hypothetical protein